MEVKSLKSSLARGLALTIVIGYPDEGQETFLEKTIRPHIVLLRRINWLHTCGSGSCQRGYTLFFFFLSNIVDQMFWQNSTGKKILGK
jgi:hypothetical protein